MFFNFEQYSYTSCWNKHNMIYNIIFLNNFLSQLVLILVILYCTCNFDEFKKYYVQVTLGRRGQEEI